MWILGLMLFILGLVFVIVAPINKKKNARCSAQTQGVMTKKFDRVGSGGARGHSYIYTYSVDGVEYQTRSTIHSSEAYDVGDTCTIWYDPKDPKTAQPFRYKSTKIYTVLLIVGIILIPLGFLLTALGAAMQSMG